MLANVVTNTIGKGGTGKTTMLANLAASAASGGWNVLCVDADPQNNLRLDFGIEDTDNGVSLANAIIDPTENSPTIIPNIRERVDLIAGGEALNEAIHHIHLTEDYTGIEQVLTPLAPRYNLILVDTGPGDKVLQESILRAAGHIIIPVQADRGSIQGLATLGLRLQKAGQINVLGVVITGLGRRSSRIEQSTRVELGKILEGIRVFNTVIHYSEKGAVETRRAGIVAAEYEAAAKSKTAGDGSVGKQIHEQNSRTIRSYSSAAEGLANDYQQLSNEVLDALKTANAAYAANAS